MASSSQLRNLEKCKNKHVHNWQDEGKEKDGYPNYCYYCKKCGKKKIKSSMYSAEYYDKNGNLIGCTAPECIAN